MSLATMTWIITIVFCAVFFWISWRVKDNASSSFVHYAIAGGTLPLIMVLFTDVSTIMGAGNFIGHASKAFEIGYTQIPFIFGEQGSKILFALAFAGLAGRFTYISISEMMDDLIIRDKASRAIIGVLTASIMIAWVGGQGKGLGAIFAQFTGLDPLPVILVFSAVFILYTYLGGIYAVVWTDLIQGIMVIVFGIIFYIYALAPIDFSLTVLNEKLVAVGAAELTNTNIPMGTILNKFITGSFGVLAAQIYWQRCFASKDSKTARRGMFISGVLAITAVSLTAIVGLVAKALNPTMDAANAMPWLMTNQVPVGITAMVFALILAAAMSSADSNLNSASVIIVNDLIRPFAPDLPDEQLVKYAKNLTIVVGVFAAIAAIYASSIISLFSKAYTMAGGSVVPVLLVGLLWKRDPSEMFTMGVHNSKVTPWGSRVGLVVGAVVSLTVGILWGVAISALSTIIVSLMTPQSELAYEAEVTKDEE